MPLAWAAPHTAVMRYSPLWGAQAARAAMAWYIASSRSKRTAVATCGQMKRNSNKFTLSSKCPRPAASTTFPAVAASPTPPTMREKKKPLTRQTCVVTTSASAKAAQVRILKAATCKTTLPSKSSRPVPGNKVARRNRGNPSHKRQAFQTLGGVGNSDRPSRLHKRSKSTSMHKQGIPSWVAISSAALNSPPASTPAHSIIPYNTATPLQSKVMSWQSWAASDLAGNSSPRNKQLSTSLWPACARAFNAAPASWLSISTGTGGSLPLICCTAVRKRPSTRSCTMRTGNIARSEITIKPTAPARPACQALLARGNGSPRSIRAKWPVRLPLGQGSRPWGLSGS
mmetsp:Transcript_28552/g.68669  ORF Transcript_28552/g.68669 Transcript_28552/m.68669 type:complete len:342 (-) Transcript_28552:498-1523(-)